MSTKIISVCLALTLAVAAEGQSPKAAASATPKAGTPQASATPKPSPVRSSYRVYDDYDRFGFYIGGGATYALEMFKDNHGLNPTNGWAMNFRGGYRFDPNWAAELNLEYYFGEFEFETRSPKGADLERLDGINVTANGKYYTPGSWVDPYRWIQPYLMAGGGVGFYQLEFFGDRHGEWDVGPIIRGGPGIDIYITRDLLIMGEMNYVLPFGDIDNYRTLAATFGGGFRF